MTLQPLGSLKEVFEDVGVARIVWIDDLFDEVSDPALTIELAGAIERERVSGRVPVHPTFAGVVPGDELAWTAAIGAVAALSEDERRDLLRQLGGASELEFGDAEIKAILESAGGKIETLGFRSWRTRRAELKATFDSATIVVVDRDMARGGAGVEEGELIVKELAADCPGLAAVMMLTQAVETEGAEALNADISGRHGLARETFAVVSKRGASTPEAAEKALRHSFRVILTHRATGKVVAAVATAMTTALEAARKQLAGESVYHLDKIVFQNSFEEGASEVDVVARLLMLRLRVAVEVSTAADAELAKTVASLRRVRTGDAFSGTSLTPSALAAWRQDEVFDPGERINSACSPLVCGDVFERKSGKLFVLLGQPCDLAVRPDGHRKLQEAVMVPLQRRKQRVETAPATQDPGGAAVQPVVTVAAERGPEQRPGSASTDEENQAPFFGLPPLPVLAKEGDDSRLRIDFRTAASVNLAVVEWACLNVEGAVSFDAGATEPLGLRPGWSRRWSEAKQVLTVAKESYAALPPRTKADEFALRYLPKLSLAEHLPKAARWDPSNASAVYDFRRVGRLRPPWAVAAYAAFSSYQTRAAFDHDFARGLSVE